MNTWRELIKCSSCETLWYDGLKLFWQQADDHVKEMFWCDAYQHGYLSLCQWLRERFHFTRDDSAKAFAIACQEGHWHMMRWIAKEFVLTKEDITGNWHALMYALGGGHLDVAEWIVKEFQFTKEDFKSSRKYRFVPLTLSTLCLRRQYRSDLLTTFSNNESFVKIAFVQACGNGHLREAQWLSSHFDFVNPFLLTNMLIVACSQGHLAVAQWLCEKYNAGFNRMVFGQVSKHVCRMGYTDVWQWITDKFPQHKVMDYYPQLFATACGHGHLNLVQLIFKECKDKVSTCDRDSALWHACRGGHLPVVEWIYKSMPLTKEGKHRPFKEACKYGRLSVAMWLYKTFDIRKDDIPTDLFIQVCKNKHFQVAQWLHATFDFSRGCEREKVDAFRIVCGYGFLDMAKWLYQTFELNLLLYPNAMHHAFIRACIGEHMEVVFWLCQIFDYQKDIALEAFQEKCLYQGVEILQWLHRQFDFSLEDVKSKDDIALQNAFQNSRQDVVQWLAKTFYFKDSYNACSSYGKLVR